MKRLEEFRIFYNHTIHPELLRLERMRIRLLLLLAFSVVALIGIIAFEFYVGELVLTLALMIPIAIFMGYLVVRVRKFIQTFKPNTINLILDFIDDGLNYGTLSYQAEKSIPKDVFLSSHLFSTKKPVYRGEDFIQGKIGSLDFEMCEINVEDVSPVSSGLQPVFRGVFLHAKFNFELEGVVIVWPRKHKQKLVGAVKNATFLGAKNKDDEILCEPFRKIFTTYATEDTHVVGMLPITMQEAIVSYLEEIEHREQMKVDEQMGNTTPQERDFYLSIIGNNIYVAFTEEKDLLEPFIFKSNLSFDLLREFFEDIHLLLKIVEDFDQTH